MKISFGNITIKLNVFHLHKQQEDKDDDEDEIHMINFIGIIVDDDKPPSLN